MTTKTKYRLYATAMLLFYNLKKSLTHVALFTDDLLLYILSVGGLYVLLM